MWGSVLIFRSQKGACERKPVGSAVLFCYTRCLRMNLLGRNMSTEIKIKFLTLFIVVLGLLLTAQVWSSALRKFFPLILWFLCPSDVLVQPTSDTAFLQYDMIRYDMFVNCIWVDARWQQYTTVHIYTHNTQNNTMKQNTQNGPYIRTRIHKLQN